MPNWKKIIVSGSSASLQSLNVTDGITGSLDGNSSTSTSSSYALSASYLIGAVDPFPYTGSAQITGSLSVTGSVDFSYISGSAGASAWSAGGAMITARYNLAGAGTQNAGLAFGGLAPASVTCTEEYDGTSWTAGGALITAAFVLAGAGTQTQV